MTKNIYELLQAIIPELAQQDLPDDLENYDLFDEFESFNSAMAYDTNQTWILLYYINEDCSEAHFEISLPISLENGQVTGWKKRFIFDPIIRSQPAFNKKDVEANFSEEIDLVITRKNG